jgi:hypothetical protein
MLLKLIDSSFRPNYRKIPAVVLLARGAHCSDLAKARTASLNIYPPHVVKYLIIFDSPEDMYLRLKDMETIHVAGSQTVIEETTAGARGRVTPHRYTKDISVYILHTSLLSGTGESRWIVLVDFSAFSTRAHNC